MRRSIFLAATFLLLVSISIAQTVAPPEELAVRNAYAQAAASIGKVVVNNVLAKGPLPDGFDLNAAGVPMFMISNVTIGRVADLPDNLNALVTSKSPTSSFLSVGTDGLAHWQTASQFDSPLLLSTIQGTGNIYNQYVHYDVGVSFAGKTVNYRALALLGQDVGGNSAVRVLDNIATLFNHGPNAPHKRQCPDPDVPCNGGENGGTGESYDMNIANSGDGYSLDIAFQPNLPGLNVWSIPSQWIDPVLSDPLWSPGPNLGNPDCTQCIGDRQGRCGAGFNAAVWTACGVAGITVAVCAVATVVSGGAMTATCVNGAVVGIASCAASYPIAREVFNSCTTNVKWDCYSACNK